MTSDAVWTYTWNGENRLIEAVKTNDKKLEFAYDYMGRRIYKKVYNWVSDAWSLSNHRKYVYNDYKLLAEYDGVSGSLLRKYIWQPASVGQDVPLSVADTGAGTTYYYIVDGNKNVRALIDSSGNVLAEYDYTPFGRINSQSGTYASINPFRFSSEYHDDETKLVYYNYRYYSTELGRWLSRDPIQENGSVNIYGTVHNSPVSRIDINGLWDGMCGVSTRDKSYYNTIAYKQNHGLENEESSNSKSIIRALQEYLKAYLAMRKANVIGADKYFHCIAHCKVAKLYSPGMAKWLGILREVTDNMTKYVNSGLKGKVCKELRDQLSDSKEDLKANKTGYTSPSSKSCEETCSKYKVKGL